jgi:hypothetical protein
MAMSGVPVIVSGQTHYRGRGFTQDPASWEAYYQTLDHALQSPERRTLSEAQVNQAWNYAYRFFFEYPLQFPWHLLSFGTELESWPVERALSAEGLAVFGRAFRCLAGEPLDWPEDGPADTLADMPSIEPLDAGQPGQYFEGATA